MLHRVQDSWVQSATQHSVAKNLFFGFQIQDCWLETIFLMLQMCGNALKGNWWSTLMLLSGKGDDCLTIFFEFVRILKEEILEFTTKI